MIGPKTMLSLGAGFMESFWSPELEVIPLRASDWMQGMANYRYADFAYAMNMTPEQPAWVRDARDAAKRRGIPTVWHTIEDPNSFDAFAGQAAGFDIIATTDRVLIPQYQQMHPSAQVIWLPLAASRYWHFAEPMIRPEVDFILIANWYDNEARHRAMATLDPIISGADRGDWTFRLMCYDDAPWPSRWLKWRTGACNHLDVGKYYHRAGCVLGINNQDTKTAMTSMRTFEALACCRPFLTPRSDGYAALGFQNGTHMAIADDAVGMDFLAHRMVKDRAWAGSIAAAGWAHVMKHHLYTNRLAWIGDALPRREP